MTPRLKLTISKEIEPTLKEKFGYKNLYMGPRIQKIVLNMGLGLDGNDQKILKSCHGMISKFFDHFRQDLNPYLKLFFVFLDPCINFYSQIFLLMLAQFLWIWLVLI